MTEKYSEAPNIKRNTISGEKFCGERQTGFIRVMIKRMIMFFPKQQP